MPPAHIVPGGSQPTTSTPAPSRPRTPRGVPSDPPEKDPRTLKFTEVDLKPEIISALDEMGFHDMTPIQEEAIPHVLDGRDVVGLAETGSGKTSACAIPLVQMTDPDSGHIQHLILVPTRELALQYVQEIDDVAKDTNVVPFAVFGGFDIGIQKAKLRHGVHILVAPGLGQSSRGFETQWPSMQTPVWAWLLHSQSRTQAAPLGSTVPSLTRPEQGSEEPQACRVKSRTRAAGKASFLMAVSYGVREEDTMLVSRGSTSTRSGCDLSVIACLGMMPVGPVYIQVEVVLARPIDREAEG